MTGRNSGATERAIRRHMIHGEAPGAAARAEGIHPATLRRAIIRRRAEAGDAVPRTVIAGAGGLGRELAAWISAERAAVRIAYLSDQAIPGLPIIGAFGGYTPEPGDELLIGIGDPDARAGATARVGQPVAGYVSASAIVAAGSSVGPGCMLLPRTMVSAGVRLGAGVLLNVHTTVGHDAQIGDWTTLSAHVDITGRVRIGERVFVGSGARVIPGVTIGDRATIGAGSVVMHDVPDDASVAGNPARRIA